MNTLFEVSLSDTNLDVHDSCGDVSAFEHDAARMKISLWKVTSQNLIQHFSASTEFLFYFLKVNIYLYGLLTLVSLVSIVPQWVEQYRKCKDVNMMDCAMLLFFVSNTSENQLRYWAFGIGLISAVYMAFVLWFRFSHKARRERLRLQDTQWGLYDQQGNTHCVNATGYSLSSSFFGLTLRSRTMLNFLSALIFAILLGSYAVIQVFIQREVILTHGTPLAIVGGIVHVIFKSCWRFGCWLLSHLERYETATPLHVSYFIKIYLFDGITFVIFYLTHRFISEQNGSDCETDWIAKQYLVVLILDYVWVGLFDSILAKFQRNCSMFPKYRMNLPDEYTRALMRQYLTISGYFLVTALPLLSFLFSIVEYWRSLHKLLRLSTKPVRSAHDFGSVIVFAMCTNILFALVGYPGWLWYIFYSGRMNENCGQDNILSLI